MTPSSSAPVPVRSPTTSGDPSSVRAMTFSSCAVSRASASTFWSTFTIRSVSSRRATRSNESPRSPCGRERKKPVFASAPRVSSRSRSLFIAPCHRVCFYINAAERPSRHASGRHPLRTLYRAPAVRRSRMAGELIADRVVVEDSAEGSALHNRGFFGRPRPGGGLELDLLEAIYLVEADRLAVRRKGRAVSARELFRAASTAIESFEIRYLVYRDLRQRGYVVE